MPKPPTLQDLLARFQISEGQLDAKLSDEHLPAIARFINHGILGPELGLTPPEMEAIEADGRTEDLRRLKTLRRWKEKYSFKATYQELLEALLRCGHGMAEHAEKVCNILSPLPETHLESNQESNDESTPTVQQDLPSVTKAAAVPESIDQPKGALPPAQQDTPSSTTREDPVKSKVEVSLPGQQDASSSGGHSSPEDDNNETGTSTPDSKFTEFRKGLAILEEMFYKLVDSTADDLKAHSVDLAKVKQEVISHRISNNDGQPRPALDDNVTKEIKKAESSDDLIIALQKIWDPLNPALLQKVVQFGSDNIKEEMKVFMKELCEFRTKTQLREFAKHSACQKPDSDISYVFEVTYKMGKDWEERNLEDFENLKCEHARKGYIEEHALNIRRARKSSIILVWEVPFPSYKAAFHQIPHSFFERNDVKKVTVDGVTLYDSDMDQNQSQTEGRDSRSEMVAFDEEEKFPNSEQHVMVDESLSGEGAVATAQNENEIVDRELSQLSCTPWPA